MSSSGYYPVFIPLEVSVDQTMIRVRFESGLELATPVVQFPRLALAAPEKRKRWRMVGKGDGIYWPDVDEHISIRGLFFGSRSAPLRPIEEVPSLIGDLYRTTQRLNSIFKGRPFTPDGHLIGSIGEVVAEYVYGLELAPCSTPRIDAWTPDRRSVQIKLTGGRCYGIRWSSADASKQPELLICLRLSPDGFEEVYNGVFPVALLQGKQDQLNGQISITVSSLRKLNGSLVPQKQGFDCINRWFTPGFDYVV